MRCSIWCALFETSQHCFSYIRFPIEVLYFGRTWTIQADMLKPIQTFHTSMFQYIELLRFRIWMMNWPCHKFKTQCEASFAISHNHTYTIMSHMTYRFFCISMSLSLSLSLHLDTYVNESTLLWEWKVSMQQISKKLSKDNSNAQWACIHVP